MNQKYLLISFTVGIFVQHELYASARASCSTNSTDLVIQKYVVSNKEFS